VKAAPVAVTEETVTLTVPLFVSVSVLVAVLPVLILPKENDVGEAESDGATPVPLTAIAKGDVAPSLMMASPAESAPAVVGAHRTVMSTLAPTATVAGIVGPVIVTGASVLVMDEMMTGFPPVFVSVSSWVFTVPTPTLPKEIAPGEAANCPAVVAVPERLTVDVPLVASLVKVTVPVALPAAFGA
jgi:hypothetical protein